MRTRKILSLLAIVLLPCSAFTQSARAIASWASVVAWSEFDYQARDGAFTITSRPGNYFWSNGYAWGTVNVGKDANGATGVNVEVAHGSLKIAVIEAKGGGASKLKKSVTIGEGKSVQVKISSPR